MDISETQTRLLLAAERLFAQEGIDAVSTRRIAEAAGQRNISATAYHFGTKEQLIDALLALRMHDINRRREALLDRLQKKLAQKKSKPQLHDWLEALVLPLVAELENKESHFAGCLQQLYSRKRGGQVYANLDAVLTSGITRAVEGITAALKNLPHEIFLLRMNLLASQMIHSVGDWYYQRERGEELAPIATLAAGLIDFLVGGLQAPMTKPSALHSKAKKPVAKRKTK